MENNVTSFEELKKYAEGEVVTLPPFGANMPFVARMRRPSLMVLMKTGKIPNSLLNAATELFMSNGKQELTGESLKEITGIVEALAEASFVSPSWKDIQKSGISLTDEQILFIFTYTQQGVTDLDSFRKE